VKYKGYWEFDLKDVNEVDTAYVKMEEQRAKEPEKWAKVIENPMVFGGRGKGYTIFEADDLDQLGRLSVWMVPWVRFKFVALFDAQAQMALMAEKEKILAEA